MQSNLNSFVDTALKLVTNAASWLQARRIPLWTVPVALVILVGGCNLLGGDGGKKEAVNACREWYTDRSNDRNFEVFKYERDGADHSILAHTPYGNVGCIYDSKTHKIYQASQF